MCFCAKISKWSKKFDKKAASPPHVDGSIVFTRWRQCAPHLTHASLGPPESIPQTTSRWVQPFCAGYRRVPLYFTMGCPSPPQNCSFPREMWTPLTHGSLDAPETSTQSRSVQPLLQGLLLRQTDRQTDRPRNSVCNNRPYLRR